jgi:hypothetical protein
MVYNKTLQAISFNVLAYTKKLQAICCSVLAIYLKVLAIYFYIMAQKRTCPILLLQIPG